MSAPIEPAVEELLAALREAGEALDLASAAICAYDDHDPSVGAACNLAYRNICVVLAKHGEPSP